MSELDPTALTATMPFAMHTGVQITAASREAVVGHLDWSEERCTIGGLMHGGALMTLADSLGAVAAFLHLPEGAGTATVSSSTSLLRGLREGRATGTATVINAGRRFITVRTDVVDEESRLLITTTQVQAVLA
ncbi:MAG: PaaI family thioesterase [Acidimicrobiales bacterium]|nr:PaaI family thioesterase [Acidimicrobiales bacterium]